MNNTDDGSPSDSPKFISRRSMVFGTLAASLIASVASQSDFARPAFAAVPVVVPPFTVANQRFTRPVLPSTADSVGYWNNGASPYQTTQRHCGQDYWGDDVVIAVASGWVREVSTDYDGGYGWNVTMEHPNGKWSFYGHMADQAVVAEGQWVDRGGILGEVGGSANGNLGAYDKHCHLAIASTKANLTARNSSGGALSIDPEVYIPSTANFDDPTYEEEATLPVYDSNSFAQSTAVTSSWGNIFIASGAVSTFISGPKQVSVTATVAVSGLTAGKAVRVRIARLNNETVIDTAATVTVVGDGSSTIYVNIAGIAQLASGRKLRLQATTTDSGVTVTNVDVVSHSWAA